MWGGVPGRVGAAARKHACTAWHLAVVRQVCWAWGGGSSGAGGSCAQLRRVTPPLNTGAGPIQRSPMQNTHAAYTQGPQRMALGYMTTQHTPPPSSAATQSDPKGVGLRGVLCGHASASGRTSTPKR